MSEVSANIETICRELVSSKLTPQAIEEELKTRDFNADDIIKCLKEIKRMRNVKKRSTGFIYMATGAFLGFLSCVLTITHAIPQLFGLIFYGLTIVAVLIVVLGLYYVFE
jgi:hypothetical protein